MAAAATASATKYASAATTHADAPTPVNVVLRSFSAGGVTDLNVEQGGGSGHLLFAQRPVDRCVTETEVNASGARRRPGWTVEDCKLPFTAMFTELCTEAVDLEHE